MGPFKDTDSCKTCGQLEYKCPGHCGYIELVKPVYNPLLFNNLKSLLNIVCFFCHKFRFGEDKAKQYAEILTLIARGDVLAAKGLEASAMSGVFFSEHSEGESDIEEKSAAAPSCELATDSKDAKKNTWTSLQYAEAISVISIMMKSHPAKCANYGRRNPKISSPTFGWLCKVKFSAGRFSEGGVRASWCVQLGDHLVVPVENLPLELKMKERMEQKLRMKLAKKIRLRRKRLLRKRQMRKKGRWPPSMMKKLKNVIPNCRSRRRSCCKLKALRFWRSTRYGMAHIRFCNLQELLAKLVVT